MAYYITENSQLSLVTGCEVLYTIRTHQAMQKIQHLIPENVVVGNNDVIPGLSDVRDPKQGKTFWYAGWGSQAIYLDLLHIYHS